MKNSKKRLENIINAYTSNYVTPIDYNMYPDLQQQYYPDQEQSYTDLQTLDSPHGELTFNERYKLVYPGEWSNPEWAGGNFLSPYKNDLTNMTRTPNDNVLLQLTSSEITDLGHSKSSAVDNFLSPKEEIIKISSAMDLSDFMRLSEDTLIHRSKKDLWRVFKDADNNTYIKRLFDGELIGE